MKIINMLIKSKLKKNLKLLISKVSYQMALLIVETEEMFEHAFGSMQNPVQTLRVSLLCDCI